MRHHGFSLLEILVVLALAAVLTALAAPPYIALRDAAATRAAASAAVAAFDAARSLALTRARHAAIRIDTAPSRIIVHSLTDTLLRLPLTAAWGVQLTASRDSSAVAPDGLGYGAANLRLIIRRGAAAETLNVSRLGRVTRR